MSAEYTGPWWITRDSNKEGALLDVVEVWSGKTSIAYSGSPLVDMMQPIQHEA